MATMALKSNVRTTSKAKTPSKSSGKVKSAVKKGANAVKTTVKKGASAVKSTTNKVTTKAKNYSMTLKEAYNAGYKSGVVDAQNIKNSSAGARISAKTGYGNALKNQNKLEKLTNKAKKANK